MRPAPPDRSRQRSSRRPTHHPTGQPRARGARRSSLWRAGLGLGLVLFAGCAHQPASDPVAPPEGDTAQPDTVEPNAPAQEPVVADTPPVVLRGARVMTATGVIYPSADVLLQGGKIVAVGPKLDAPEGARVVDVSGKTITPGIIDTHSHLGVYAAPGFTAHSDGNEAVAPVTPYVRAADGYWPQDPQIERARAGGITTMQVLPGSANLIGGRSVTVRLRPGARNSEDARFEVAPFGLKMACGENPKRVYGDKGGPQTRMGNMAGFRAAFQRAVEYQRSWANFEAASKNAEDGGDDSDAPTPPSRDFGLETLVGVLEGEILVHNHCYRADEMIGMMALADEFGFKIRSFHHAVEAYKIADRIAAHGGSASVWADWWGFKAEAFDGVRENAAMVASAGARAIIHSDSPNGIQRLNQEAAKAMHAGRRAGLDVSEDEALRWITLNPAWALGIDAHTGTLEPGKLADVVVWSGNPFSVYSKAELVYLAGEVVYDREHPNPAHTTDFETGFRTSAADAAAQGADR